MSVIGRDCPDCDGTGWLGHATGEGQMAADSIRCGLCDGEGKVVPASRAGAVSVRDAAEKVSAAWDAWMNSEEDEGQDAVAEAIGELRAALGGQ